ncbi:alpha/beta-hydrolase [Mytilinidion resinicola]|uniref:Alpha/beta-hydrolase n=1 Tax=Mytilinidion resinicola TaxID=574789 RepID=A0A6A6ZBH8_9PEZI|nr:alpha/beta-hydrolase [Mytilinidion resinicola]KAF2817664.1 alpha/beta-hydrolase [Mytilinidion resinicola]
MSPVNGSLSQTEIYQPANEIKTNDGVALRYISAGSGPPLLLIHGWSQTAAQWSKQIVEFKRTRRVIAIDLRGHGESDKPGHGYRISRLAADVHDLITQLDLNDLTVVGHSMGCSVIWCYLDLFPGTRISKLVFIDEPVSLAINPAWSEEEAKLSGAVFSSAAAYDLAAALRSSDGEAASVGVLASMKTSEMSQEDFDWIAAQNLKMPRKLAAELFLPHALADWSDVISRIKLPTLVISGEASMIASTAAPWIAARIAGAKCRVLSKEERGSHFMMWENPAVINATLREFLEDAS